MTDTDEARRLAVEDSVAGALVRARLREGRPLDHTLDRALSEPIEEPATEPASDADDDERDLEGVLARARQREGRG